MHPSSPPTCDRIKCAALGGNLNILKWLVDDNCCPIKSVRVSGRCRDASNSFTEISTSKGRSLLGIALENHNVGIVRYLVVDKGIQLTGEKDITMDTLCQNLDLVLRLLPEEASRHTGNAYSGALHLAALAEEVAIYESAGNETHEHEMRALNDNASDVSVTDVSFLFWTVFLKRPELNFIPLFSRPASYALMLQSIAWQHLVDIRCAVWSAVRTLRGVLSVL